MRMAGTVGSLCAWGTIAAIAWCGQACSGQDGVVPKSLHVREEIPVSSLPMRSRGFRTICGDGRFYIQTGAGQYSVVDLEGQAHAALDTAKVPANQSLNPRDLLITDLEPSPHGGVIATVVGEDSSKTNRAAILRFDEDGDFDRSITLDSDLHPARVAEFNSSGGFVVAGYDDRGRDYLALIDLHGKVVVPHLLAPEVADLGSRPNPAGSTAPEAAIKAGSIKMVSGDDDAVYLFDPSRGRKITRIQPSGETTELPLGTAPSSSSGRPALPLELALSHGRIYLNEAMLDPGQRPAGVPRLTEYLLSVFDRYSGELEAIFQSDEPFGSTLITASPAALYFLDARVEHAVIRLSIVRADP